MSFLPVILTDQFLSCGVLWQEILKYWPAFLTVQHIAGCALVANTISISKHCPLILPKSNHMGVQRKMWRLSLQICKRVENEWTLFLHVSCALMSLACGEIGILTLEPLLKINQ